MISSSSSWRFFNASILNRLVYLFLHIHIFIHLKMSSAFSGKINISQALLSNVKGEAYFSPHSFGISYFCSFIFSLSKRSANNAYLFILLHYPLQVGFVFAKYHSITYVKFYHWWLYCFFLPYHYTLHMRNLSHVAF